MEGRTPDIAYLDPTPKPDAPHPDKFSDSAPKRSSSSAGASPSQPSSSTGTQNPAPETANKAAGAKKAEKEPELVDPYPSPHHDGVGEKVAHAIGGAIGWAERLFGRLTKDKKEEK